MYKPFTDLYSTLLITFLLAWEDTLNLKTLKKCGVAFIVLFAQVEEAVMVFEDDSPGPMDAVGTPGTLRNLSAWTISIPYVDFFDDEVKKERIPVFCIDVERNDRKNGEFRNPFTLNSTSIFVLDVL